MQELNFKLIATQIGESLKYDTTIKEIDRLGQSILKIQKIDFSNNAISSTRSLSVYSWILSLERVSMNNDERVVRLIKFCRELTPEENIKKTIKILANNNCPYNLLYKDSLDEFLNRNFHPEVNKNSQKLFLQKNYFHAVFESSKAYNKCVKEKSQNNKDGQSLMQNVWDSDNGVLKLTPCESDTDKNFNNGIKFLSAGLMAAIRNPTAHEPAITWPIEKQDCLDILSLISFLYKQLDKSVYFKL